MPDHDPFDGTVPYVLKAKTWIAVRPGDTTPLPRFPTWREAMNYATKEDPR